MAERELTAHVIHHCLALGPLERWTSQRGTWLATARCFSALACAVDVELVRELRNGWRGRILTAASCPVRRWRLLQWLARLRGAVWMTWSSTA